jgi:ABC-type antimicrobial peptide transport system permease subunit
MVLSLLFLMGSMQRNVGRMGRELCVLWSVGLSRWQMVRMCVWEAFVVVLVGCVIGVALWMAAACGIILIFAIITFGPPAFYFPWVDVIRMFALVVVLSFLATLQPVLAKLKKSLAELIREG